MNKFPLLLLLLAAMAGFAGCAAGGGPALDAISANELAGRRIIILTPPYQPAAVKKELWERSMAAFGLEAAMTENVTQRTSAQVLSERAAAEIFGDAQRIQANLVGTLKQGLNENPKITKTPVGVIEDQYGRLPDVLELDFVLLGWISKFTVIGQTRSFAGPVSSSARECQVWAETVLYDLKHKKFYRNRGEVTYTVNSLGVLVTPGSVITNFDLSAAGRAAQDAMGRALSALFGQ